MFRISCRKALSLPDSADFLIDVPDDVIGFRWPEPTQITSVLHCAMGSVGFPNLDRAGHPLHRFGIKRAKTNLQAEFVR